MAGTVAAIAAARQGARTVLFERHGFLGGAATAGAVGQFVGWETRAGRRVIAGLAEEIVQRLEAMDGSSGHGHFVMSTGHRMDRVEYDTEILKVVLDEMVHEAGVRVLLHSQLAGASRRGRAITSATLSGLSRYFITCGLVYCNPPVRTGSCLKSLKYRTSPAPTCRRLDAQATDFACACALFRRGKRNPIRIAMMPTTTSNSTNVKARRRRDRAGKHVPRSPGMLFRRRFRGSRSRTELESLRAVGPRIVFKVFTGIRIDAVFDK